MAAITNAERIAKWRAENPSRAKAQTRDAGRRYLERKPSIFPLEISQHPVLNSTNTPTLDDGENVVGWSTLLEYDDGFEREILALRDDATPLHAIHELAHLANFVDGWPADSHGTIWRTRFESLIAERYGAEVTP